MRDRDKPRRQPRRPDRDRPPVPARTPRPGPTLVHEDEDIIVLDKPVGLSSAIPRDPGAPPSRERTLFDMVKRHVREGGGRGARAWVVHRLDKDASGLIVFARSQRAFDWLKDDLRTRRVHRLYLALVAGEFADSGKGENAADLGAGTIQTLIRERPSGPVECIPLTPRARQGSDRPISPGEPRLAITHYRVLASGKGLSLLQVRLESGRKHQIRAHLASIGHPIVGDRLYAGRDTPDPLGRLGLHAAELGFTHPGTGETRRFFSAAPEGFWRSVGMKPPPARAQEAPMLLARKVRPPTPARSETSWDHVAGWYDELIEERRNDLFHRVVLPGTVRLLRPHRGMRVLDVACGQGSLCRALADLGTRCVGLDASPRLIEAATKRGGEGLAYGTADATKPETYSSELVTPGSFDGATCVMALMNMDPLSGVLTGCARALRPGGSLVAVILHPAFRSPGITAWGWDANRQYRRVDAYLTPVRREVVMNPGYAARGEREVVTTTYHRPLQTYIDALREAGFTLDSVEEWVSPRVSQPGPRATEENRARREIPMFMGLRATLRIAAASGPAHKA